MFSYDAWKTATPWDDETEFTVSFTCGECEAEVEDLQVMGSRGADDVQAECTECGVENFVDVGGGW